MKYDTTSFQERYNRWKNGENYWDIVGSPLPKYKKGKSDDELYYSYMDKLSYKKAKDWNEDPDVTLTNMLNDNTYNYRAFYENDKRNANKMLTSDPDAHFSDVGKTMYHPTFSNQSIYSGKVSDYNPLGINGGTWLDDYNYKPSNDQLNKYFNYKETRNYLDRDKVGRKVNIVLPAYKGGKDAPSKRLYNYIRQKEGSDYAKLVQLFGNPVDKHYTWTKNAVGDDVWNKLTPQLKDALTSYRYNIRYESFQPTVRALRRWATTQSYDDLVRVKDSMNIGMNRKGYSGLHKRRLEELNWFMEGVRRPFIKPVVNETVHVPDNTNVAKPVISIPLPYVGNKTKAISPITYAEPLEPQQYAMNTNYANLPPIELMMQKAYNGEDIIPLPNFI